MKLNISSSSCVGCVRIHNEDMILVGDKYVRDGELSAEADLGAADRFMVALADGMGGHNSGDVASSDVLHNLRFYFDDLPAGMKAGDFNEAFCEWLRSVNKLIDSKGLGNRRYYNMGTTLVAFAYYGADFYWMNCGDSRIYRLHDDGLSQLSTDHSLNTLTGSTQHSNIITNCIGGGCKTSYIDIVNCTASVVPGDTFLLCSDGLNDMVADCDIQRLLNEGADAGALCQAAVDAGGYDNVSACVIKIED